MDYSIRRRLDDMGYDRETVDDLASEIADTKRQDAYIEARESALALAKSQGHAMIVSAGEGYAVLAARTREACKVLLAGRRPLAEFAGSTS